MFIWFDWLQKKITRNEKVFKLDEYEIEEPIESLVRHVEPNNPDVFIHSWSKQHKNYLKTKLKPKEYIFKITNYLLKILIVEKTT